MTSERFDWSDIRAQWVAYAEDVDKRPRDVTRAELAANTTISASAFNTNRGGKKYRTAKDDLFPLPVPAEVYPRGHDLKGVSSLVGPDGKVKAQWIRTDKRKEDREEILRRALEDIPRFVPVRETISATPDGFRSEDILAVYPMGDPHVGMLAWGGDAEEDWDLAKCQSLMRRAVAFLAKQGMGARQAALINLGDYFHADNQTGKTRRSGHRLDMAGRYGQIAQLGVYLAVSMIEILMAYHDEVLVINEIGNHDDDSSIWLSVALDAYFHKEPRVTVDLSAQQFHYFRHGKCLVGVTHGDSRAAKMTDLGEIMAYDRRADWSDTEHRYWYTGHVHHRREIELRSCLVESFRTLAPRDAHAQGEGYRGRRDMTKILLHSRNGETGRFTADHRMLEELPDDA